MLGGVRMSSGPEPVGLAADSLQPNSNLLQRNSNITAIEFQQFQPLCVPELFCIRGLARSSAVQGAVLAGLIAPNFAEIRTYLCGIDFQCLAGRVSLTYCKASMDFRPLTEKLAERGTEGPLARNYLSTKSLHSRKPRNLVPNQRQRNGRDHFLFWREFMAAAMS